METVIEFMQANWLSILILAFFLVGLVIYVSWLIKKNGLRKTVVDLIVKAEDMYNDGANEEKINYVIDKVIGMLPLLLQVFVTRTSVRNFIQKVFDETKRALDYQK